MRCGSCGAGVDEKAESCDYCQSPIIRDKRKLSLICPECFGRNPKDSSFCTGCGVEFRPHKVNTEGHEVTCPACSGKMPPHSIGGVGVNECPDCHGLWVPQKNFNVLINKAIDARRNIEAGGYQVPQPRRQGGNPITQKVVYRSCPECERQMARRNFRKGSGVIIDNCREHGTWLDADELEAIAGFIVAGNTKPGGQAQAQTEAQDQAYAFPQGNSAAAAQMPKPQMSERTRKILEQRKRERERKANRPTTGQVVSSIFSFLDDLLT